MIFKKHNAFLIIFSAIFIVWPNLSFADIGCSSSGYTISAINGIFTDKKGAEDNEKWLKYYVGDNYKDQKIDYHYLLNPSHVGGLGDILAAVYQGIFDQETVEDYDLVGILKDASEKVHTQKLLLVAHSQGNFYANSFYDVVAGKQGGVSAESIGVYGVATPASRVAGGGRWLTSDTDRVIASIVGRLPFKKIISPNTHIALQGDDGALGHDFKDVYLKYRSPEIVADIQASLDTLKVDDARSEQFPCIPPPKITLAHTLTGAALAVVDPVANTTRDAVVAALGGMYQAGGALARGIYSATNFFSDSIASLLFVNDKNLADANVAAVVASPKSDFGLPQKSDFMDTTNRNGEPKVLGAATGEGAGIPEIEMQEVPLLSPQPKTETPQKPSAPDFTNLFPVPIIGVGGGGGGAERAGNIVSVTADTIPPDAPIILTPANLSQTFTTTAITFSGTAETGSMIATDFGSATTTADGAGNWTLALSGFSQGTTTAQFYAADTSGNVSAPTSAAFFIDSIGPDISLTVSSCTDSIGVSECLVATTTIALSWNSPAPDTDHFVVDWGSGSVLGTTTSASFTAVDNSIVTIIATAYDANGNAGAMTTKVVRIATLPVVINEVAWAGTGYSPADEWIELYNPTDADIVLSSFTLFADSLSPYLPLSGTIPARGYYLIERKNTGEINESTESPIIDIPADLWTSFGGGLSNAGERMRLVRVLGNATTTVDEISYCSGWCGYGTTHVYKTMERVDAGRPGTDWTNWGTNTGTIKNGNALNTIGIFGTPKARNYMSHLVNRNQNITNNLTLAKSKSPYLVDNTVVSLSAGKTLTIEPGVVIKFNNAGLVGNGSIIARGTESDPIVFTSFYDDAYGGDTNQDGFCDPGNASSTAGCPLAGAWRGVDIFSTSIDSVFDYTIFRYGGQNSPYYKQANLSVEGVSPAITNSIFEYAGKYGAALLYASSTVSNNIFRNNKKDVFSCGLFVNVSAPTVSDNTFSGNKHGLCVSSTAGEFRNNTFTNNTGDAIMGTHRFPGRVVGNTGSGNGRNGISLNGFVTKTGDTLTLEANGLPYLITENTTVSASSTLVVGPNITIKFQDRFLNILGSFIVSGPALFTSVYDDSDGTDALNDGPIPAGIGGLQEIRLENGSSSDIKDAEFRYFKYALSYANSPVSLENALFYKNALGILAGGGTSILKAINVSFVENTATSTIPLP